MFKKWLIACLAIENQVILQIENHYIMRKAKLISQIAEKTGLSKVDVLVVIEQCLREIKDTLATGESIFIRGFGSFVTKTRARKVGRDIKNNISLEIPESRIPAFRPAKEFIDGVKNGVPLSENTQGKYGYYDDADDE